MTDTTAVQDTTATSNARRRTRGKGTLYKRPGSSSGGSPSAIAAG